jgi:hypothetical protein
MMPSPPEDLVFGPQATLIVVIVPYGPKERVTAFPRAQEFTVKIGEQLVTEFEEAPGTL